MVNIEGKMFVLNEWIIEDAPSDSCMLALMEENDIVSETVFLFLLPPSIFFLSFAFYLLLSISFHLLLLLLKYNTRKPFIRSTNNLSR